MKSIKIVSFHKPATWQRSVDTDPVTAAGAVFQDSQRAECGKQIALKWIIHASPVSLSLSQVDHQLCGHLHRSLRKGSRPLHGGDKWRPQPVVQLRLHCRGSVQVKGSPLSLLSEEEEQKRRKNEDCLILRLIKLLSRANNNGLLRKVTGLMKRVFSFSALLSPVSLRWCSDNVSAS